MREGMRKRTNVTVYVHIYRSSAEHEEDDTGIYVNRKYWNKEVNIQGSLREVVVVVAC